MNKMLIWAGGALAILAMLLGVGAGAPTVAAPLPEEAEAIPGEARVETVLSGLNVPTAMAFAPDGRLFFTERTGAVRVVVDGQLQASPVVTFDVEDAGEQGLLGIAIDPDFANNHYIYVFYTQPAVRDRINKVVRFVESNGSGSDSTEIYQSPNSAGSTNHNGGNIHFGPDGKLYITIGDDAISATAQNESLKNGKIHRINADGSIPDDNPVFTATTALPTLYARGLRNSFDFAFDPVSGTLWASENGPSCDDELNRILPGGNYGWRASYPCEDEAGPNPTYNTNPPQWYLTEGTCCLAPTGVEFYSGNRIPGWNNTLFMCDYNSGRMRHFYLNEARDQVTRVGLIEDVRCNMDIQTGPDGALYFLQGGGYSTGTRRRITGPEQAQPTATPAPATATPAPPPGGPLISTADPLFYRVWERVDRPVLELVANRSWTWGPRGGEAPQEPYGDGTRLVQYFDKARMELNPAAGSNQAFVTNGLSVVELIGGQMQIGPTNYEARQPSTLPIGGDGANNPAPSYAALRGVASLQGENQAQDRNGQEVTATIDKDGNVGTGGPAGQVRVAQFVPETGHNIPDVFWTFLNQRGTVYENGAYQEGPILDWVFTVGYPITEPYWTTMQVENQVQNVLVQAYQRQVLTYIPSYQPPWHVQFGNVGQHYYSWRYSVAP